MGRCRFVQPDVVRLSLSDGDFIDVKRELNVGEQRRVFAKMVRDGVHVGEQAVLDPERVGMTRVQEYLVDWSFVDADGKPTPVSESAIQSLDGDTFREIVAALDTHEAEQERHREDERKNRIGASGLRAIS